jgi:hypothetical protein
MRYKHMGNVHHVSPEKAPQHFLLASLRGLIPTLAVDLGGTLGVYFLLAPYFASTSIWPLFFASLVPTISNVFSLVRRRQVDIVGIIVLLGLFTSILTVVLGGDQRMLLVRESFMTGLTGLVLFVSPIVGKPLGYYIVRQFLSENEHQHNMKFDRLWESSFFRKTIRFGTYFWGMLLLTEFGLRVFMALTLPIVFALAFGPIILNGLMLGGGALSAVAMSRAIKVALTPSPAGG